MSILNENLNLDDVIILDNIRKYPLEPIPNNPYIEWRENDISKYRRIPEHATLKDGILRCDGEMRYHGAQADKKCPSMLYIKGIDCPKIMIDGFQTDDYPHFLKGNSIRLMAGNKCIDCLQVEGDYVNIQTWDREMTLNKCDIKTTILSLTALHPIFINSHIMCKCIKLHHNDIFSFLDNSWVREHVILHKHYRNWADIRAIINNPNKFQDLTPDNPKLWFKFKNFDTIVEVLGLSGVECLENIILRDHLISIQFSKLPDGGWNVGFFRNDKQVS